MLLDHGNKPTGIPRHRSRKVSTHAEVRLFSCGQLDRSIRNTSATSMFFFGNTVMHAGKPFNTTQKAKFMLSLTFRTVGWVLYPVWTKDYYTHPGLLLTKHSSRRQVLTRSRVHQNTHVPGYFSTRRRAPLKTRSPTPFIPSPAKASFHESG